MKRILLFGMSNNPGGMEHYINNLIKNADHESFSFDFLTVFNEIVNEIEYTSNNIKVHKIVPFIKNPILHIIQLKKIVNENNYSAIYMNIMDAGSAFTAYVAKVFGLRVIVHSHNSNSERPLLHKMFRPLLNRSADIKLACGKKAGQFMFGNDDFEIIPNAFSFKSYYFNNDDRLSIRNKLGIANDTLVFIHVGRMEKQKNPLYIIDILYEVYKLNKNIKMIYIGDGSYKDAILNRIDNKECGSFKDNKNDSNGFINVFKFIGSIDKEEISKYLSASDIFLLPSFYEGLSFSLLEAEVNGLCCLVSNKIDEDNRINHNIEFLDIDNSNSIKNEWETSINNYSLIENRIEGRSDLDNFQDSIYNIDNDKFKTIINNVLRRL